MWQAIAAITDVPADRQVCLAFLARGEFRALVFPCRRFGQAWFDANSGRPVDVHPTHWRDWLPEDARS
jgi:hypothetical protein